MKIDVWSALPPAPTGIADYVAEGLPELARRADIVCRVEEPSRVEASIRRAFDVRQAGLPSEAALDVYHLGNSPAQGFVWRAARRSPGVVVLHEWCLADVIRHETLGRGDTRTWRREMRLGGGTNGAFFARLVEQGMAGEFLPLCFPSNGPLLLGARGIVTQSRAMAERVRRLRLPVPVLALAQHVCVPPGVHDRSAARAALRIPESRFLIVAPGLATPAKRIGATVAAVVRLVGQGIDAGLLVAGESDPPALVRSLAEEAGVASRVLETGRLPEDAFTAALVAADVVVALRFPSHGETSAAALRAMGLGACVLLTAGSETALEVPRGTCVTVSPRESESEELAALLLALAQRPQWRSTLGASARAHIGQHHSVQDTVSRLHTFLESVALSFNDNLPRAERFGRARHHSAGVRLQIAEELIEEARLAALGAGLDPSLVPLDGAVDSLYGGPV